MAAGFCTDPLGELTALPRPIAAFGRKKKGREQKNWKGKEVELVEEKVDRKRQRKGEGRAKG